jgi:hypothetical protein
MQIAHHLATHPTHHGAMAIDDRCEGHFGHLPIRLDEPREQLPVR